MIYQVTSRIILAGLVATACLSAESAVLSSPGGDWVASGSTRVLRPVAGIPGARILGQQSSAAPVVAAAPGGAFAIAEGADGLSAVRSANGKSVSTHLRPRADLVSLSPTGSAAAFYESDSGRVEVWSMSRSSPARLATWSAAGLPNPVRSLEVSDDGAACLVLTDAGEAFRLVADGAPRLAGLPKGTRAIRFLPASSKVLFLEAEANLSEADLDGGAVRQVASLERNNLRGLAVAADGNSAVAVSDDSLVFVMLDSGQVHELEWKHGAPRVSALRNGFAIAAEGTTGVWMVDRQLSPVYVPGS